MLGAMVPPTLRDVYQDILVFRGDPPAESPDQATSSIGGTWRTPSISRSYLLAARTTLDQAHVWGMLSELTLPIAFQQRHAFELGVKELLTACYGLERDRAWLHLLSQDPHARRPEGKDPAETHDLHSLVGDLALALKNAGEAYLPIPPAFKAMAKTLTDIEQSHHDRLRYEHIRLKKKEPLTPSFSQPQVFQLGTVQDDLEQLFTKYILCSRHEHTDGETGTLLGWLVDEGMSLDQWIYPILEDAGELHHVDDDDEIIIG